MADATLAEMTIRVLEKLHVLVAGETVEAEDSVLVQKIIVSANDELRELGLCYWEDSATPQHLIEQLARRYACYLASEYMDEGEAQGYRSENFEPSLMKLRELCATTKRVEMPVRAMYF